MKTILMNKDMTKAILDGRKTMTRRVAKVYDVTPYYIKNNVDEVVIKHSKYQKGDILAVREPAKIESTFFMDGTLCMSFKYLADEDKEAESVIEIPERFIDTDFDNNHDGDRDEPKPKWIRECQGVPNGCIIEMYRIFLEIVDVRVEIDARDKKYYFIYDFKRVENE